MVLGPNGAGKTTLLQVSSTTSTRPRASSASSGEVIGTVDVFELRPRIGLASVAIGDRVPRGELVNDVVMSASYAVLGRWKEEYDDLDRVRAADLLREVGVATSPTASSGR